MCFPKPKVDTTVRDKQLEEAELARKKEEEREARILEGTEAIDKQFSVFDDAFYNDRREKFMGYYQPQLDSQFQDAQDELTFAFARNGLTNSSAAAEKQASLLESYDNERAGLISQADADIADTQSRFQSEKSALVSQLNATGNAEQASNEALARTQQLFHETPKYSTLGPVFAGITNGIGAYNQGRNQAQQYNSYFGSNSPTSSSSSRTVQ